MFDGRGIGIEDLAWIQRDQFVHYVESARALSDPNDWPRLREDLVDALTAAFGLDAGRWKVGGRHVTAQRQRAARELLEELRTLHDPAADWPGFFDALWERRRDLRNDL